MEGLLNIPIYILHTDALLECSVCYENNIAIHQTEMIGGCFHRFCKTCLQQWFQTSATCPLCRERCTELFQFVSPHTPNEFRITYETFSEYVAEIQQGKIK